MTNPILQAIFQSTLPTRGSDLWPRSSVYTCKDFNPRSPRGGATCLTLTGQAGTMYFNPRSPRGGATSAPASRVRPPVFQSTLPTRGSDHKAAFVLRGQVDFNPRSPRGGATRASGTPFALATNFNPRSPRGGATSGRWVSLCCRHRFQSTLPTRGSDWQRCDSAGRQRISIHAPHEGERRRKSAFVCSISANLLNIIHCGTVTRAVSRRRIALFRLFSVRRSGVFMYAYASH